MTSEVKLLTEAEWRKLLAPHPFMDDVITAIAMKGLIAPEPVDPLDAVWEVYGRTPGSAAHCTPSEKTKAFRDALREVGMELRPQLTRERVREAMELVFPCPWPSGYADALHAALTDGGRDG